MIKLEISAETKENADQIINALLDAKLVTGGQIVEGPARFLWKQNIVDMDYWTINSFTIDAHRDAITEIVSKVSIEEVPMIVFVTAEGNPVLENWVNQTVASAT